MLGVMGVSCVHRALALRSVTVVLTRALHRLRSKGGSRFQAALTAIACRATQPHGLAAGVLARLVDVASWRSVASKPLVVRASSPA